MIDLRLGDCLQIMQTIPDKSIDAIITDPPYGTTACKWDSVIPFDLMWEQLNRVIKPNGAIVLFGSQPFTSALISSNYKFFKYEWIWHKNKGGNPMNAKFQPMKQHENILVFGNGKVIYNPIKEERAASGLARVKSSRIKGGSLKEDSVYSGGSITEIFTNYDELRYPQTVQKVNVERGLHPTQKPVTLMEYLIKTYTNENETVLDFTMGSGSTMVACKNINRNGIGIEKEEKYFNIAKQRVEYVEPQTTLF
jgi:site-specific DNA-methyltransferase (adenine-specific)